MEWQARIASAGKEEQIARCARDDKWGVGTTVWRARLKTTGQSCDPSPANCAGSGWHVAPIHSTTSKARAAEASRYTDSAAARSKEPHGARQKHLRC